MTRFGKLIKLDEAYVSDEEYGSYYPKLNGLRTRVARDLPLEPGMRIIDVAAGSGYFAIEVAKLDSSLRIVGVDITEDSIKSFRNNVAKMGLDDRVEVLEMDASDMMFPDGMFDMAVNFTGLEDIHMTRGRTGVLRTFHEVSRVLKPGRYFCFVVMPPEEMETEPQRLEVAIFSYICDATWLSAKDYINMAVEAGFRLINRRSYYTGKKLTQGQAREEIKFACENVPRIYGKCTPTFQEVWNRFGQDIERHGLGHYSKVVSMITQKTEH